MVEMIGSVMVILISKDCMMVEHGRLYVDSLEGSAGETFRKEMKLNGGFKQDMDDKGNLKKRFDTSAGNPIKEILLKLNLPDHRILKDGHGGTCDEALKSKNFKEVSVTLITERFSQSDEVLKLKNFKKDASLKLSSYQIKKGAQDPYLHTSQDKGTSSSLKSMITTQRSKTKDQLLHKKDSRSRQEASTINDQGHKERSL
ncbi:hypothetical protein Tco_0333047 [Tanacetum coccineum]